MRLVEGTAAVDDVDEFVATLGDIGETHDCAVQAFDARYVAGRAHLATAVSHANRSVARGENVADDRTVEILLYAAGRRQITQALTMGVEPGEGPVVVVVDGGDERDGPTDRVGEGGRVEQVGEDGGTDVFDRDGPRDRPDEDVAAAAVGELLSPEPTLGVAADVERLCAFFDVTEAERAATDADLEALVCERVALLDVEK